MPNELGESCIIYHIIRTYARTHTLAHTRTRTLARTHARTHARTRTRTRTHTHTHTHTHTTRTHTRARAHTHTHTRARAHTHTTHAHAHYNNYDNQGTHYNSLLISLEPFGQENTLTFKDHWPHDLHYLAERCFRTRWGTEPPGGAIGSKHNGGGGGGGCRPEHSTLGLGETLERKTDTLKEHRE